MKLHGTFAGVKYNKTTKELTALSKGSKLTIAKDNAQFAFFVESHRNYLIDYMRVIPGDWEEIMLTGEFAGPRIQKGTGINLIPERTFFMFGMKFKRPDSDDWEWAQKPEVILRVIANDKNIRSIFEFMTYDLVIDFAKPEEGLLHIDAIRDSIDTQCPVAHALGFEGVGEGVVFVGYHNDNRYVFKHKGESHETASKGRRKKEEDPEAEKKAELADKLTPVWRLEQMYAETFDTLNGGHGEMKGLGVVIKAVIQDVIKEEMETFKETKYTIKDVQKYISAIARDFVKAEIEREAMQ